MRVLPRDFVLEQAVHGDVLAETERLLLDRFAEDHLKMDFAHMAAIPLVMHWPATLCCEGFGATQAIRCTRLLFPQPYSWMHRPNRRS